MNTDQSISKHLLLIITMSQSSPMFGGFSTCFVREQGQSQMPGTKAVYIPLIDMTPSDSTTMLTALMEAQALTKETGQVYIQSNLVPMNLRGCK